jgi:hypothetical protein
MLPVRPEDFFEYRADDSGTLLKVARYRKKWPPEHSPLSRLLKVGFISLLVPFTQIEGFFCPQ